jgi:hypothetical protein
VNETSIEFAEGRLHGVLESSWTCGDCDNVYDAAVDHCPNRLLDAAHVKLRQAKALHRIHTAAPPADDGVDCSD